MFSSHAAGERVSGDQYEAGLNLLASQRKLPGGSLILGVILARTSRSRRFLGHRKAMMGKDGNAFEADPSPVQCGGNV